MTGDDQSGGGGRLPSPEIESFDFASCMRATSPRSSPGRLLEKETFRRTGFRMSGKYAFTKTLKELRFLHCQTSEHSNAVRYAGAS